VVEGGAHAAEYFDGNPHRFPPSISEGLVENGGRPSGLHLAGS
jgi:hypothetical protein